MAFRIAGFETEKVTFTTPIFAGPLDLLLTLIERAELDITKLSLAQVTDQYLNYLAELEEKNPLEISAFIVLAARLLQIKSSVLLPKIETQDENAETEDDGEALVRQLKEYQLVKRLTLWFSEREKTGLRTYLSVSPPPIIEPKLDLSGISLLDLQKIAEEIFNPLSNIPTLSKVMKIPKITIREKIQIIIDRIRAHPVIFFKSLIVGDSSRLSVVVTFLAMLELIKQCMIEIEQEVQFGDISIRQNGDFREEFIAASEFGE